MKPQFALNTDEEFYPHKKKSRDEGLTHRRTNTKRPDEFDSNSNLNNLVN